MIMARGGTASATRSTDRGTKDRAKIQITSCVLCVNSFTAVSPFSCSFSHPANQPKMNTLNPAPAPAPASAASKRKQKRSPTLEVDCQPDVDALSPASPPSTPMAEQQRSDPPAAGRGSTKKKKKKKKGTSPASQNMADATDPATQYLLATTSPRSDKNVGAPPASGGSAGPTPSQLRELLGQDRAAAGRHFSSAAGAEPTREGNDDDETVRGRTGEGREGADADGVNAGANTRTDSAEPWEDRCHPEEDSTAASIASFLDVAARDATARAGRRERMLGIVESLLAGQNHVLQDLVAAEREEAVVSAGVAHDAIAAIR